MSRQQKGAALSAKRPAFTTISMNDTWQVVETASGLYELAARDGSAKLGPMEGKKLVGVLAVVSELERHLREGR
jgi:hypothetical protein